MRSLLAICCLAARAIAQPPTQPTPPPTPPAFLVQIESKTSSGTTPTYSPGIVTTGGSVITTFDSLATATEATILTSDGQRHATRGIISHFTSANLALLAVDWTGPTPEPAPLATSSPKPSSTIIAWLLPAPTEKPIQSRSITRATLSGPTFQLDIPLALSLCRSGAVAIDDQGRVIGLGTNAQVVVPTPPHDAVNTLLSISRSELLAALKLHDVIKWSDWPLTLERCKRAEELGAEALANAQASKLKLASREVSQALVLDPFCGPALRAKADILKRANRAPEALAAFDDAIKIDPTDTWSLARRALLISELKTPDDALTAINEALAQNPSSSLLHQIKGAILEAANHPDQAIPAYDEALRIDPDNKQAQAAIARLRAASPHSKP